MAKVKKAVTMSDIAARMQVSTVTVSKALSGQKGVSEEVREKIVALAKEMGYRLPGSSESRKESFRIGVLMPAGVQGTNDSFYWKMYQAVSDMAMQENSFTSYETLTEEMAENKVLPRLVTDRIVDGLVVIGKPDNDYSSFLEKNAGMPLAFMDFTETFLDVECFVSDGFYGTHLLTAYLLARGHRDIAYVGTLFATESITDRYMGYLKAMMECGIIPPQDYTIPDRELEDGVSKNYQEFQLPEKMPSAFVCNCDLTANLLVRHLKEKGIRVPQDVSVVGYDNYPGPYIGEIGITTYAVDIPGMAKEAVLSLIRQMKGEKVKKGVHIVEGYLVEKDSVAEYRKDA